VEIELSSSSGFGGGGVFFSAWLAGLATNSGAVAFPQKPLLSETILQNLLD
jgi:hypothetical protein